MSDLNSDLMNKKKGLGRGLGSLIAGPAAVVSNDINGNVDLMMKPNNNFGPKNNNMTTVNKLTTEQNQNDIQKPNMDNSRIWNLGIDKLKSGKYQPRKSFEKEPLEELAQSIKQNGILQPIIVRKINENSFEIIAGERRWRAAQLAGKHEVPVIIREYSNEQSLELAIIENVQRENLNAVEEAEAYSRLIEEFNLSQQEVAEKVGKERATITNALRLLTLPLEIRRYIIDGMLSAGHGKVLLSIVDSQKQIEAAKITIKNNLSVRKLEKLAIELNNQNNSSNLQQTKTEQELKEIGIIKQIEEKIQKKFSTKVLIQYENGKGKISLNFYSKEEFNNLIEILEG